jgi:bla regulator protein blaR1
VTTVIVNHLWQSTLFALAAAPLTQLLRNNAARFRYWVWLAASIKFLIPFSWLTLLGSQLVSHSAISGHVLSESYISVVRQIADPLDTPAIIMRAPPPTGLPVGELLAAIWLAGCGALLARWLTQWWRVRAATRLATPAPVEAPIAVRSTPLLWEPGVVGILRPVLLLPDGISARLTPSQLQAVIAHELCHVRRRDNLTAAIHMLVEVLFWFHPLVWWIGARLVDERERACDEAVVELGNEPQTYAESILKVCQFYVESKLSCISGVSGSGRSLKKRIEEIMKNQLKAHLSSAKKVLLTGVAAAALVLPVVVGLITSPRAIAQTADSFSASMAFDDVKISKATGKGSIGIGIGDNERLSSRNETLRTVIAYAYDADITSVVGGPAWLDKPAYNIVAHARTAVKSGDDMRPLLKTLLADRFGLQAHSDVRKLAAFALRVGQGGSKLSPAPAFSSEVSGGRHPSPSIWANDDVFVATYISQKELTQQISRNMGRPVLDQTGLSGPYDFTLRGPRTPEALPAELQEQLRLQLDAVTAPINVIVVDEVHEPTLDVRSASVSSVDVQAGVFASDAAARRSP